MRLRISPMLFESSQFCAVNVVCMTMWIWVLWMLFTPAIDLNDFFIFRVSSLSRTHMIQES